LAGDEKYDAKSKEKRKLCEAHGIKLIAIFPKDLVSSKKLEAMLLTGLGPVDKPVLARARPERLGRCSTDLAKGVTCRAVDPTGKQRIQGCRRGFQKES
jgi:hypothetical protein